MTIQILLKRCAYKKKPEEYVIRMLCIAPEAYIHGEIFNDKKKIFGGVYLLIDYITKSNVFYNSVASHLDRKNINADTIFKMFQFINTSISLALEYYMIIFKNNNPSESNKQELSEGIFQDMKELLDFYEEQGLKLDSLNAGEAYSPENYQDPIFLFFNPSNDNNQFKEEYSEYSNKYIGYLLYEDVIALEKKTTTTTSNTRRNSKARQTEGKHGGGGGYLSGNMTPRIFPSPDVGVY